MRRKGCPFATKGTRRKMKRIVAEPKGRILPSAARDNQDRSLFPVETLDAAVKKMRQSVAVVAAQGERCAVIEHDLTIAMKHRLEFSYSVHLHDCRAMDSHEFPRIQPGLKITNPLPDDVLAPLDMDSHIVTPGFDPIDIFCFQDSKRSICAYSDALQYSGIVRRSNMTGNGQRSYAAIRASPTHLQSRSVERCLKLMRINGFCQKVEAYCGEAVECAMIIRSHKNDCGNCCQFEDTRKREMLFVGHIDIEDDQIELLVFCQVADLNTVGTLTNEIDVR